MRIVLLAHILCMTYFIITLFIYEKTPAVQGYLAGLQLPTRTHLVWRVCSPCAQTLYLSSPSFAFQPAAFRDTSRPGRLSFDWLFSSSAKQHHEAVQHLLPVLLLGPVRSGFNDEDTIRRHPVMGNLQQTFAHLIRQRARIRNIKSQLNSSFHFVDILSARAGSPRIPVFEFTFSNKHIFFHYQFFNGNHLFILTPEYQPPAHSQTQQRVFYAASLASSKASQLTCSLVVSIFQVHLGIRIV